MGYLESLPEQEFLCGLAEVIKYALIRDADFYRFLHQERIRILQRDQLLLEKIVETCCAIKADIVGRDEKETTGERMILNFGHSTGHAIERLTEYRKFRHGEAVAMGMIQAARLSHHFKYCDESLVQEIHDMVSAYGLPVRLTRYSKKDWEKSLRRDKKMHGEKLQFVFIEKIGKVRVESIAPDEIAGFLAKAK